MVPLTRTVQLGLGVLAVVAATAFSRRGSSRSLEGTSREDCESDFKSMFEQDWSSVPEVLFSNIVDSKNSDISLQNKMVDLDRIYSAIFGQYSDDLIYELSEDGYQSNFPRLTPVAKSGEWTPNVDFYKMSLVEMFSSRPDLEKLWVQLVDRIKVAKALNELTRILFDVDPRDPSVDPRHPPSGWYTLMKHGKNTGKVISHGAGVYSFVQDEKTMAKGSIHLVARAVTGTMTNGFAYFWLGQAGDSFVPSDPPQIWKIERTPERELALEDAISLFCELKPFAYKKKWWNDIEWPADMRPVRIR